MKDSLHFLPFHFRDPLLKNVLSTLSVAPKVWLDLQQHWLENVNSWVLLRLTESESLGAEPSNLSFQQTLLVIPMYA